MWLWRKEGSKRRDRRRANGGDRGGREREKSTGGGGRGGGGWWDVVIARPIHHAVPAGMHWGQSCTTQLQPVLGCRVGLHSVPTMPLMSFVTFALSELRCIPLCVCLFSLFRPFVAHLHFITSERAADAIAK